MYDRKLEKSESVSIIEDPKINVWNVEPSTSANNCRNFIREIVDNLDLQPNPEKSVIALSIGDPTVYGNLKAAEETVEAVKSALVEGLFNGYVASSGHQEAKQAVAEYLSQNDVQIDANDVILCSGCSSSLEHCITVLADGTKNQNIVIPRPGFPIYRTLAEHIGVEVRYYNLMPENNWEADLDHLESQIDEKTAAIVVNNPSNPCGSSFSEEHLRNILEIAYRYRVPVIADEIYENLVFPGEKFVSAASLNSGVPILVCGGIAKRFLVPGWRLGWIIVHDEFGVLNNVRKALNSLTQRIIGSNTLIQGALPAILKNTPQSFFDSLIGTLANNAKLAFERLQSTEGLTPFMPQGTMYMLVEIQMEKFPAFADGLEFAQKMMEEESVFCLPGECFAIPGFLRIVLTVPEDLLEEACARMMEFCKRHYKH
ncbi:unnamed protein product [Phyllotreta striolata]|uniref:Tyrosine aminotransferase n=1 Tax=Phyllotreta striolata TaxID=444603 RepID=A0A9N9TNR6_PHYSR|nr:unnamed protein product [Phyllotreta striolata]